ncbi:GNAT family N-acetyltransferase [Sphingosinicella microcystinivorans]|uniref:Acetyltransferase (GNAT) family protein n=1 Tax=Sphingosinicella microcystinivorans TaxID=335406 RepID=A0AAD1G2E0_SPHMI|nr:GNAT family N-acetyltransferase [Sphingosinicella microcystinivorans]RKS88096.1 acetyltransferase (GNAT) family protein [Sphingosinicella microcystinivorans]BBE35907.1 N-acetyltransferase [Sphingosinicella microcystinivorans]
MSDIVFRTPTAADLPALCELGRQTFIETFGHLYAKHDLDHFLVTVFGPEGMPVEFADPAYAFRIAEADGRMVAYCKVGPPYLPVDDDGRTKCELRQLYILKAWHGRGIAQPMMAWALEWANMGGWQDMYLTVWSENYRAQKVYENYGFEKVGDHRFMVGEQADHDFIYRKVLRP